MSGFLRTRLTYLQPKSMAEFIDSATLIILSFTFGVHLAGHHMHQITPGKHPTIPLFADPFCWWLAGGFLCVSCHVWKRVQEDEAARKATELALDIADACSSTQGKQQ